MSAPEPAASGAHPGDEESSGLGLLFLFSLASLLVVIAVGVLGVVGAWWMLGVAMVVHLSMTTAVMLGLARALADRRGQVGPAPSTSARSARLRGRPVTTA